MRTIQEPCRLSLRNRLASSWPLGVCQSVDKGTRQVLARVWDGDSSSLEELFGQSNSKGSIDALVFSAETEGDAGNDWNDLEWGLTLAEPALITHADLLRARLEHLSSLVLWYTERWYARLVDSSFVSRDLLDGVAQDGSVIESQCRDTSDYRFGNNVRRIVSSSDTDF